MNLYHATTAEAAASIRANGLDATRLGIVGGSQHGLGLNTARTQEEAERWNRKLYDENGIILTFAIDDALVADYETTRQAAQEGFREWALERGYAELRDGGCYFSFAAFQAHMPLASEDEVRRAMSDFMVEDGAMLTAVGLRLAEAGYAAYTPEPDIVIVRDLTAVRLVETTDEGSN